MDIQEIKQRFGIIGNSPLLNRAIDIANQVAPTDISVLITGESGSGKEVFSHIIHQISPRKHGPFIAVNCGAIPEGTIDSELFGHEKGAYTGAVGERKGYFETVNGGTIFLDEIAEMPLGTQARLLRVLESGQFIKVGSSKVEKTNVRVIAATNVDVYDAVKAGKFREDLYYRLNTVPLRIPPLRDRKEDVYLLFRKFTSDFTDKYRTPPIQLDDEAQQVLVNYSWPGNVRQLKNMAEQLAVLERDRIITAQTLLTYIPHETSRSNLPMRLDNQPKEDFSERDILYKVLFDMKRDMVELKKLVANIIEHGGVPANYDDHSQAINQLYRDIELPQSTEAQFTLHHPVNASINTPVSNHNHNNNNNDYHITHEAEEVEESLSLIEKESDLIRKALKKHKGKRKLAAGELGISERTLYRKIKELNL
ncbi:sigma-54 dependent transcriptional regulator [Mucilaginibacter sp. UR6-1]|uniref:sigma-54 interaction domain-containing protein n=1 Tax=Mucilaginibacter sp. UR6-1 TaxID=1435643 RepID=UPI001E3B39A4|nr:sigma-54 dependent transcriptional regulator [Mucilaginibacter sp. UR6-1]MCC8408427.1 sigma-54 dependent transcriptional regulator [Mucilaginibacter sp. UR6-1]